MNINFSNIKIIFYLIRLRKNYLNYKKFKILKRIKVIKDFK